MRGFSQQLRISPRDSRLPSSPVTINVPVATTRVVNFFNEFLGMASSLQILNRDGTNTVTIIINNDRINTFTIPASASISFSDQWIEQVEVVSGALGVTVLFIQIVPGRDIGLSVI